MNDLTYREWASEVSRRKWELAQAAWEAGELKPSELHAAMVAHQRESQALIDISAELPDTRTRRPQRPA